MKAKVTFLRCLQDSQDLGSDDEHMVSRVFFTMAVDGQTYNELYVDLKQTVGSNFEMGNIEVGRPNGYQRPFKYLAFRDAAEQYYRSLIGSSGGMINVQEGANIRMRNNIIVRDMIVEFEINEATTSW
jgi:hypothetical protein